MDVFILLTLPEYLWYEKCRDFDKWLSLIMILTYDERTLDLSIVYIDTKKHVNYILSLLVLRDHSCSLNPSLEMTSNFHLYYRMNSSVRTLITNHVGPN